MIRELQSIIGLLNFCVVVPGRACLRRLIDLAKGVSKPHHYIRLTKAIRADLQAWYTFIQNCNGRNMFLNQIWESSDKLHLYTDAAGSIGYGAVYKIHWFYGLRCEPVSGYTITFKELYPIVLAVKVWGHHFQNSFIICHSDNQAIVHVLNKQTSKEPKIMALVRRLVLVCLEKKYVSASKAYTWKLQCST